MQSNWPTLPAEHPLLALHAALPSLIADAGGHSRVFGITLSPPIQPSTSEGAEALDAQPQQPDFATLVVLQKFLRSTQGDVEKAKESLRKTLKWRREFGLDKDGEEGEVEKDAGDARFNGLGHITKLRFEDGEEKVVTWNIYGAAKNDIKGVFGDLDKFLHWRVDLMERSIKAILAPVLSGDKDAKPIPDYGKGEDPYQGYQVHDYQDVSFLRMDPAIKAASSKTIEIMQAHYPEWLSRKFFVSVPLVMSWVFTAVRLIVSSETARKFTVVSYKTNLLPELEGPGKKVDAQSVPKEYGGGSGRMLAEMRVA
ncbi:hypothetical protein JCM8547_002482 [Rhodosporidiobolus lusitaniae]